MIYDCFTFFNEIDLLEARLEYLDPIVDHFVIAESNLTYSGNDKPYNFQANIDRYKKWKDKIIYLPLEQSTEGLSFNTVNSYTPSDGAWILENEQRNGLFHIEDLIQNDDILLISDLDEFPRLEKIIEFKEASSGGVKINPHAFRQLFHYYYMNCQNVGFERIWNGSVITQGDVFKREGPQYFRDHRNDFRGIENGGFHWSFLGGLEKIKYKIHSFAHTEFNRPDLTSDEHIIKCLEEGHDVFNRPGVSYKFYPVSWYPEEIQKIMLKYPKFIKAI